MTERRKYRATKARSNKVDLKNPIYLWRIKNDVTRRELENMITTPYVDIYNWECGHTVPSEESIEKLTKVGVKKSTLIAHLVNNIETREKKKASQIDLYMKNPITKWRLEKGVRSRSILAKKLGVSRQTLLNWETGKFLPGEKHLFRLANIMGKAAFGLYDELVEWKKKLD